MAAQPASTVPTISPAEMQILISRSGLMLNPGQMADLVLAWRQVAGLIAAIPQGRALADDSALSFRLPGPASSAGGAALKPAVAAGDKSAAKAVSRPVATPKAAGKGAARAKAKAAPRAGGKAMTKASARAGVKAAARSGAKTTSRAGGKSASQPRAPAKAAPKAKIPPTRQAARKRASSGR
jgi:hypothetical protein